MGGHGREQESVGVRAWVCVQGQERASPCESASEHVSMRVKVGVCESTGAGENKKVWACAGKSERAQAGARGCGCE